MLKTEDWAIPKGSTVLVTGANGFIGSHIADQFLQYGFRVRGTVRNADKNMWLEHVFREKHGHGCFEMWTVPNMADQGALDTAAESKRLPLSYLLFVSPKKDGHIEVDYLYLQMSLPLFTQLLS